jgi:hypothetical protein
LVDVRHQHGALVSGALATCTCEACGGLAEFDDIPLLYMPHIAGVPPNPSPIVTALQGRAQHLELMPVVQEGLTTARQQAASALDAITNLLDARKQTR